MGCAASQGSGTHSPEQVDPPLNLSSRIIVWFKRNEDHEVVTIEERRRRMDGVAKLPHFIVGKPVPVDRVVDSIIAGVHVRCYTPLDAQTDAVVVFAHGGGSVTGSRDSHDTLCRHLSHQSRVEVVSVECAYMV
jgi:acetyl esterase/lipase